MAKKISYNGKSREELILELVKGREAVQAGYLAKRKGGKVKEYHDARKTVARILTAMNAAK